MRKCVVDLPCFMLETHILLLHAACVPLHHCRLCVHFIPTPPPPFQKKFLDLRMEGSLYQACNQLAMIGKHFQHHTISRCCVGSKSVADPGGGGPVAHLPQALSLQNQLHLQFLLITCHFVFSCSDCTRIDFRAK